MVADPPLYATLTNYPADLHFSAGIDRQQYYSMRLMYLDQQRWRPVLAARQQQQVASADVSQPTCSSMMGHPANLEPLSSGYSTLYNQPLLNPEWQTATFTEASLLSLNPPISHPGPSAPGDSAADAQQDYQMQLMLLEQQNKKRILRARRVETAACRAPSHSAPDFTGQDQA